MNMSSQIDNGENVMDNQVDKKVRIVKHSNDLKGVLSTLETTDSIDRSVNIPYLTQQQEQGINGNITPRKSFKNNNFDITYQNNDIIPNYYESYSSAINSTDRTTAPSSKFNSHFRYDTSASVSNLSPNGNGYQTPSDRLIKRRNTLCTYAENQYNDNNCNQNQLKNFHVGSNNLNSINGIGFNNCDNNIGNVGAKPISNVDLSTNSNINANANNPQLNAPVLLSAVLQVIASLQRLKNNNSQNNVDVRSDNQSYNEASSSNNIVNGNTASQILGTKLPGVHPAIAALALAYSLSVATSNPIQSRDSNNLPINNLNINSEELLQGLNQLIYERINSLNLNSKLNSDLSKNNVIKNKSISKEINNQCCNNVSYNVKNEVSNNNNAYNLNLPPMDFILTEKTTETKTYGDLNFMDNGNNISKCNELDLFEYSNYGEGNGEDSIKGYYGNLYNHKMEYDQIKLETSNNCIWDDLSYNSSLESIDFDTAYSRKHAFIRNELLFKYKPILEIERGSYYSSRNKINANKNALNNLNYTNDQIMNSKLHSICDDFLVKNSEEKNPINSINSLLQIVNGFNNSNNHDGKSMNNNSQM
ncbi:hypothetical protein FG386_000609 [Cryptosporidium ryanae]|uniref:uncharacterized protein n=1 Tax=Cryptosporidium ryanae TaxID=515981 RepID=UPI003519E386|nr:hypothetical protein FG386_000609 [Cryptosporidium ryanae]